MVTTLGPITMDFKELYMSFTKEGHKHTLKGLKCDSKIIISHHMEKLLKKVTHALLPNSMPSKLWISPP
jgi:hypothetical protein